MSVWIWRRVYKFEMSVAAQSQPWMKVVSLKLTFSTVLSASPLGFRLAKKGATTLSVAPQTVEVIVAVN